MRTCESLRPDTWTHWRSCGWGRRTEGTLWWNWTSSLEIRNSFWRNYCPIPVDPAIWEFSLLVLRNGWSLLIVLWSCLVGLWIGAIRGVWELRKSLRILLLLNRSNMRLT